MTRNWFIPAATLSLVLMVAAAHAEAPRVPENVLVKPTFLLTNGSWSAGTGFVLRAPDRSETLLITGHHLFGPAAGRERQMTPQEIARDVCAVVGLSMQDRRTVVVAQQYLDNPNARALDNAGAEKDLAAFVIAASAKPMTPSLELAEQAPRVGDTVWVYARLRSEVEPKLLPATVAQAENNWLLYEFKDTKIDLAGTSGAAVLDEKGKVVGMHLGGGEENGRLKGIANPAARMRELIKAAMN